MDMYELRVHVFKPLPEIDEGNEAVVGAPRAEFLAGPMQSVLTHGGSCRMGPAGTMGPVTREMVELGVKMLRHIADDLAEHEKRVQMRGAAPLN